MDPIARFRRLVAGARSEAERHWLIGPAGIVVVAAAAVRDGLALLEAPGVDDVCDWLDDHGMVGGEFRPGDRVRAILALGVGIELPSVDVDELHARLRAGLPEVGDDALGAVVACAGGGPSTIDAILRVATMAGSVAVDDLVRAIHGRRRASHGRVVSVTFPVSTHDAGELLVLDVARVAGSPGFAANITAAPLLTVDDAFAEAMARAWDVVGTSTFAARWSVGLDRTRRPAERVTGPSAAVAAAVALQALADDALRIDRDLVFTGALGADGTLLSLRGAPEYPGPSGTTRSQSDGDHYDQKIAAAAGRRLIVPMIDANDVGARSARITDGPLVVGLDTTASVPALLRRMDRGIAFPVARRLGDRDRIDPIDPTTLPAALSRTDRFPLAGRSSQERHVRELLATSAAGPRVVLVRGEAGSGKSRLVREAVRRAPRRAYAYFEYLVSGLVIGTATDPRAVIDEVLATDAAAIGHAIVIENAQWADPALLRRVRQIVADGVGADVVFVVTYRPLGGRDSVEPGALGELVGAARGGHPQVTELRVAPLRLADVVELVEAGCPEHRHHEQLEFADRILRLSGGQALAATQLVEAVARLSAAEGLARLDRRTGSGPVVDDIVRRRVAEIERPEVLVAAAVIGEEFDLETLRAVSQIDDDTLLGTLGVATDLRLIEEFTAPRLRHRFVHALVRDAIYASASASRRLQYHARAAAHFESAEAASDTQQFVRVAYHYGAVAPELHVDRAVASALTAGAVATTARSFDAAGHWYERAMDHARFASDLDSLVEAQVGLGRTRRRLGDPSARPILLGAARRAVEVQRADLLVEGVLAAHRGFFSQTAAVDDEWVALLERALDLVGDDDALRAELLAVLASELTWAADADRRFALADEALALAERSGDLRALVHVRYRRSLTIAAADTIEARDRNSLELLELARRTDDEEDRFTAAITRATLAAEIGRMDEALVRVADAEQSAERLREAIPSFAVRLARAGSLITQGSLDLAEAVSLEALQLGRRAEAAGDAALLHGEQMWEIYRLRGDDELLAPQAAAVSEVADERLAVFGARYALASGRADAAASAYQRVCADGPPTIDRGLTEPAVVRDLAVLATHFGDRSTAEAMRVRLAPVADRFANTTVVRACGHHALGMLHGVLGDRSGAEVHFAAAADFHSAQRTPLLLADTELEWARMRIAAGDVADARALLESARDIASALGAEGIARPASRLLDAAPGRATGGDGRGGTRV